MTGDMLFYGLALGAIALVGGFEWLTAYLIYAFIALDMAFWRQGKRK